jgi:ABC-type Fe3+ transport system permease subunit
MKSTETVNEAPRSTGTWHWVLGLGLAVAVLGFLIGPLVILLLGAGLVGGGLWTRHQSPDPRDRAVAGGLAAAGAAVLLASVLLVLLFMPTSVTIEGGSIIEDEPVLEVEASG